MDFEDEKALERLTASILRPSFAGTQLQFDEKGAQIEYRTNKGVTRSMDALDSASVAGRRVRLNG